ncbi:MAG: hypothetical protein CMP48_06190 [Rickettsiales bacterium]|nr:hypothetical protein [Rickettsiales bacterium]
MINSAEEFRNLRMSDELQEQRRAAIEVAAYSVWLDVIQRFPELKTWVIQNKTIQIEILELLALDSDPNVRSAVARKRKITDKIFELLKDDTEESVRYDLLSNTKLALEKKLRIKVDDSEWLRDQLNEQLNKQ